MLATVSVIEPTKNTTVITATGGSTRATGRNASMTANPPKPIASEGPTPNQAVTGLTSESAEATEREGESVQPRRQVGFPVGEEVLNTVDEMAPDHGVRDDHDLRPQDAMPAHEAQAVDELPGDAPPL